MAVDGPVPPGASLSAPGPGPLGSGNIAQNPQNLFGAHASVNQARGRAQQHHQASQAMLNHPAFRNSQPSMQNAPQQLQNQQLQNQQFRQRQQQQQQQQALMQSVQRPQQAAAGRIRNAPADGRRGLSQAQLHSLSLDSTLQGQKALLGSNQAAAAAAAISGDMLDGRGALSLDGLFSTVGTRNAQPRSGGSAAAGRGMMQQMAGRAQTSQGATGSNAASLRTNRGKARSFPGLQIPASEAPSTASRRGSMDISVNENRAYEDGAVEDESQPRAGPNGTSSSTKRRAASHSVSRKSGGASPTDGTVSPRTALGPAPERGAPAKRQRSTGSFQRNVAATPVVQHQKQVHGVDLGQLSRGMPQNGTQGLSAAISATRSRAQFLAMPQQRRQQQSYAQGTDRMNNAQFLSQLGTADNAMARSGNRFSRANGIPNPPSFTPTEQTENNRQREAFLQSQLSSGRRTPLNSSNEPGKAGDGRTPSRTAKANDASTSAPQGSQGQIPFPVSELPADAVLMQMLPEGLAYLSNNEIRTLPMEQVFGMHGNAQSLGLGSNGASSKKAAQNGQPDGSNGKKGGQEQQAIAPEPQQGDAHVSAQIGRKDDSASMRMRQSYGRGDMLKQNDTIQISEREMTLGNDKNNKAATNAPGTSKQNGSRGDLKRTGSSRAMKTIETTGLPRGRPQQEAANKNGNLNGSVASLPQVGLPGSMVTTGTKRDRSKAETEFETRSTKSDRPAPGSRGGGTPSQKSTASGGSAAMDGRVQGTSSSGTRRGRGRQRGRGSGSSRRGRGDRAPPRGGNGSRGGTVAQAPRTAALEQKATVSSGLQRHTEAARPPQVDSDRMMAGTSMLIPPRGNSVTHENRAQSQKVERGARASPKHTSETDLQRSSKLPFDIDDNNGNHESRGQDQAGDRQQNGNHLSNGGQAQLLEMLQQSSAGAGGRTNGDVGLDKAFTIQQLNLITGGTGKIGDQSGNNYAYEMPQFMTTGVEDADIGTMLNMNDNLGLEGPTDFEDDNILGVEDPGDLTISGRNRP